MTKNKILLLKKLPIVSMQTFRTYNMITAPLSVVLCVSVLLSGFTASFGNERSNTAHQTIVTSATSHGFSLQIDEIFEEEETEKTAAISFLNLLFLSAGFIFLFTYLFLLSKKAFASYSINTRPLKYIPIYLSVENYRL